MSGTRGGRRVLSRWRRGARDLSRLAVAAAMVVLAAAGCSSNASAPPSATSSATHSPAAGAPAGQPTKVFTDDELTAIVNAVTVRPYGASDSRSFRIGATANAWPSITSTATPAECQPFASRNPFDIARDAHVAFAQGAMPAFGEAGASPSSGSGGPTTTAIVIVRSAPEDVLASSDFNYTDSIASRCGQFGLQINQGTTASSYSLRMLPAPKVGERAFAVLQKTSPGGPGDLGGTALHVLAGTLSISLSLSVAQDADAQPALDAMAGIARKIIDQAANHPPTVSTPTPNSRTPEQLADLLRGVPGPDGSAPLVNAQLVPAPPTSSASARPTEPACTYDDAAYLGALTGSSMVQAQYSGTAAKKSFITLQAISMAGSISPPYPFDARAEALRTSPSITEDVMGVSQTRSWPSLRQLAAVPAGDAGYAVAYELPDGTGERHIAVGARRGTLSVEANDIRSTDAEVQQAAEALVALVDQVFSKAGL